MKTTERKQMFKTLLWVMNKHINHSRLTTWHRLPSLFSASLLIIYLSFTYHLFIFFLPLLTFENKRSTVVFSVWNTENTPMFYNSEALHIVKNIYRHIRLIWQPCRIPLIFSVNATETQKFLTPQTFNQCLLAALAFCSSLYRWECSLVYIAEDFVMFLVWQHTMHTYHVLTVDTRL